MSEAVLFHKVYWTSLNTGVASMRKDWAKVRVPQFFWGEDKMALREVVAAPLGFYGNQSGYFKDGDDFCFMLNQDRCAGIGCEEAGVYVAGSFNGWKEAVGKSEWQLHADEVDGIKCYLLRVAKAQFQRKDALYFKFVTGSGKWLEVPDDAPNVALDGHGNRNFQLIKARTGRHLFQFTTPLSFSKSHDRRLFLKEGKHEEFAPVHAGVFLRELRAELPLGPRIEGDSTAFRLFAPRATAVNLYLYEDKDQPDCEPVALQPVEGLVWEVRVEGNRQGWYYYYKIEGDLTEQFSHFDPQFKVLDPYALAVAGPLGPAIVVDQQKLPVPKRRFIPPNWHDLVVVEAHLRDLLEHAPIELESQERRGFAGLTKWLKDPDCYLRRLGVNAVELQPLHEFDTVNPEEYAWGYMPVNYFAPASQYAAEPQKGSQIKEMAELIEAFHDAKLAVILDVVYNHVGEPNYLQYIDKQYYFLLNEHGEYLNFSGCGNTLDADAAMVRHLMLESLKHWIEVYDVDGFRFDLGELIGVEALSYLETELKKIKPGILLIAEPWSFRGHIAEELRRTGFASWNDGYREFIKGYVMGRESADRLSYFLRGCADSLTRFPAQTVNYSESHDDRCWIDKITENADFNGSWPTATDRRRTHLMVAILMMSAGIPMLSSGMDMLKSKGGVNNTYLRGDLNALDYRRAIFHSATGDYFRAWINFRLSAPGQLLRLDGTPYNGYYEVFSEHSALLIIINQNLSRGSHRIAFAVNPHFENVDIRSDSLDLSEFKQIADHERFAAPGKSISDALLPIGRGYLSMTPLSCGLWVDNHS